MQFGKNQSTERKVPCINIRKHNLQKILIEFYNGYLLLFLLQISKSLKKNM